MSEVKVTTDHKWKNFRYRYEVPKKVLKTDFDWTNEEDYSDGFFKYRGNWYHIADFMVWTSQQEEPLKYWQAYHSDSYFSGIVIKLSDDCEQYQVGTFIA